ncbi:MAG TPA: hypothetical protein VGB37_08615 [Candidatus Lokiarchaeia archaeon]
MNNKERFEFYKKAGIIKQTAEERIKLLVNKLIDSLYIPIEGDRIDKVDLKRIKLFKIDSEPINWGDLGCAEVEKHGDFYLITIEEASPENCPTLCEYIEKYIKSWGWDVKCQTEW